MRLDNAGDYQEGEEAYTRGDYASALRKLRPLAEQGNARAQYRLGVMHAIGQGVQQSDAEAVRLFRKALGELQRLAGQGNAGAQFSLGGMYFNGWGVQQDVTTAVRWYRRAAEGGDAMSQYNIGIIYTDGRGVPQDESEAVKWFCKSAEQGNPGAQFNLGKMYATGQGVQRDSVEAEKWFSLAAAQGYADASESRDRVARINSILATGDGSRERPYVVSNVREGYLILQYFGQKLMMQALVNVNGKRMDMMSCKDGTACYFDISTFFGRLTQQL